VRGIGPLTNIVLGAPPAQAPCPAVARIGGAEFELDLREALHRAVYLDLFSIELRRVVLPLLRAGDLVVDVGANFGLWSVLAARRGCRVVAVEPVPPTRALLARNAARNGLVDQIEIAAVAVSDAPGQLEIAVPHGESGQASVSPDPADSLERHAVEATTLDALLGERAVRFLKIDVEGHELAVLRGAERLLRGGQVEYVLLELSSAVLERGGRSSGELIDLLTGAGFEFVRFIRANEGLRPRSSYGQLGLAQLRARAHAGDALWRHPAGSTAA
jgi:FkbM family methyltransferase